MSRKLRDELSHLPWAVLLTVLTPLLVVVGLARRGYRLALRFLFWAKWHHYNKFILFVYSDNPLWKSYIESNILPRIGPYAVTLNRSRPAQWRYRHLEALIWTHWGGVAEYSPLAIVFPPRLPPHVFRLWAPFKALRYGKEGPLLDLRAELSALVDQAVADLAGRQLPAAHQPAGG
jgi:hypothetical protein